VYVYVFDVLLKVTVFVPPQYTNSAAGMPVTDSLSTHPAVLFIRVSWMGELLEMFPNIIKNTAYLLP
jgi:hypothetical protein